MAGILVTNPNGVLADTGASVTIDVVAAARTFTRAAGSFVTDGFVVGRRITTFGFTNAGNNTTKVIESVTALVITVTVGTGLVNESGNGNERVQDSTGSFFRNCAVRVFDKPLLGGGTSEEPIPYYLDVYLSNSGDADLTVSAASLDTGTRFSRFFPDGEPPIVISPGENVQLKLVFEPIAGDEDTFIEDVLKITHTGTNSIYAHHISAWARPTGNAQVSISPSSWNFGYVNSRNYLAGINIGEWSNTLHLLIVNSGDQLLTIDRLNVKRPFRLEEPIPSLPTALSPGSSLLVSLSCFPNQTGTVQYNDSLEILSNAAVRVEAFVMLIPGLGVTSAFTLAGNTRSALAAFSDAVKQFDPNDLAVETTARLEKVVDMGQAWREKSLNRLRLRYEDIGAAELQVQVVTTEGTTTVSPNPTFGSAGADRKIKDRLVDVMLSERVFLIRLTHVSGQISLVDFGIEYENRGPGLTSDS